MRYLATILLFALATSSALGQSNTTAGLAGAAAGAALGANAGQGSTTPSSAGGASGGANSPIEIQIMVFKGMQDIARNIAERSVQHIFNRYGCDIRETGPFKGYTRNLRRDHETVDRDNRELEKASSTLREDREAVPQETETLKQDENRINQSREKLQADAITADHDQAALDDYLGNLGRDAMQRCSILVEDTTSASQIAFYEALQGYVHDLQSLHDQLQTYFSLQIAVSPTMSAPVANNAPPQPYGVTIKNVGSSARKIKNIGLIGIGIPFTLDPTKSTDNTLPCEPDSSYTTLNSGESCGITVTFPTKGTAPGSYSTTITILTGDPYSSNSDTTQTAQLTGTVSKQSETAQQENQALQELRETPHRLSQPSAVIKALQNEEAKKNLPSDLKKQFAKALQDYSKNRGNPNVISEPSRQTAEIAIEDQLAQTGAAPPTQSQTTPAPTGTTTPSSGTPVDMTYLSTIMTALGGIKSAITYAPTPFQPTTQAFELLVENELQARGIFSYSSTSALNLEKASQDLSHDFAKMLALGNDVTNWTNQCKPPSASPGTATQANNQIAAQPNGQANSAQTNSACNDPAVVVNLAVAQQMITGYTTLLSTASDGNGNPVIVDVLRGKVLVEKMADGIPSLQVSVAAAGGSTKSNNIFGVSLFYTFAPSYNAGVITTFELRDKENVLLDSGVQNALFAYGKWASRRFHPRDMKSAAKCGSFCSVEEQ